MKKLYISILLIFSLASMSYSQLPDGTIGRDFTIYSNDSIAYNLYSMLDSGKVVWLWFFDINSGSDDWYYWENELQDYYEIAGPDGTNEVEVLMIVVTPNATMDDMYANYYMLHTPFPVFITEDLNEDYDIDISTYYTPLYRVCPNRSTTDIEGATMAWLQILDDECPDYEPAYANDVNLWSVNDVQNLYCSGELNSSITIRNEGSESVSSLNIVRSIDDFFIDTIAWEGNISTYYFEDVDLPEITDIPEGTHQYNVSLDLSNNQTDSTDNNQITTNFKSFTNSPEVDYQIKFGLYPIETSWTITQGETELYHHNSYNNDLAYETLEDFVCLEGDQCYTFTLNDIGNDGILGGGYVLFTFRNDTLIYIPGNSFTGMISTDFCVRLDSANDLTAFSFEEQTSEAYFTNDNKVLIEVAQGTDLTNLVAFFDINSSAHAEVNGIIQESGITENDFTNPVTYSIIAENGTDNNYEVTVKTATNAESINGFKHSKIYPNPNSGMLYFSEPVNGNIEIYSITGKRVFKQNIQNTAVNISALNNGLYIIKVASKNQVFYNKLELSK